MKKIFLPFRSTKNTHSLLMAFLLVLLGTFKTFSASAADDKSVIGRWDLTVQMGDRMAPSWLEVKLSGIKTLVGYFVADGGSARPVAHVQVTDGRIHFAIPGQWDTNTRYMEFDAVIENDLLKGTITSTSGAKYAFTGVRAPLLKRTTAPAWGKPINLLNGKNTDGWHASGTNNQWTLINGVLTSPQSGSNLMTDQKFDDFKLHIEFRYPAGSNSGVYLRGRYEVQVEDNAGKEPSATYFGGIYGFLTPNEMAAKPAGEWQSYDITLIGRRVTVVANGKTIIADQIIPGITGGALDSKEGEPGPILLQGDHGPVEYRNIIITPAK
ncbi:MAG: DUF1080 domain-containing protein [Sphingobacteriia bacterium]|nr:DUF1080 domain-containing protein [Sphingobacteriia bacterium]